MKVEDFRKMLVDKVLEPKFDTLNQQMSVLATLSLLLDILLGGNDIKLKKRDSFIKENPDLILAISSFNTWLAEHRSQHSGPGRGFKVSPKKRATPEEKDGFATHRKRLSDALMVSQ